MAPSYKALWQEAEQEIAQLRQQVVDLATEVDRTRQVVDLAGIARHMLVERFTPQQWAQRDLLPPVDFPEIREPLWYVSTLKEKFVVPTRRRWFDDPETADEEDRLDVRARRKATRWNLSPTA
jgi:hypothetical protein